MIKTLLLRVHGRRPGGGATIVGIMTVRLDLGRVGPELEHGARTRERGRTSAPSAGHHALDPLSKIPEFKKSVVRISAGGT